MTEDDSARSQRERAAAARSAVDALAAARTSDVAGPDRRRLEEFASGFLAHLDAALSHAESRLFNDYILWACSRAEVLQTKRDDLAALFEYAAGEARASTDAAALDALIREGRKRLQEPPQLPEPHIDLSSPYGEVAGLYLDRLLDRDRRGAFEVVLALVDKETRLSEIYLRVLEPAQREVGRLWQLNQIGVAVEHYCSAATQLLMARVAHRYRAMATRGKTVVLSGVADELHEIGLRMVGDLLELDGWGSLYIGANCPTDQLLRSLRETRVDLLGLTISLSRHLDTAARMIGELRNDPALGKLPVLVGGNAFRGTSNLWKRIGADGFAEDAGVAIDIAHRLAGEAAT